MRCCACMETCKTRDTCIQRLHWHFVVCHFWRRTGVYEHTDIQAHTRTLHTQRFRNTRPAYRLRVGMEDYIHTTCIKDYRIRQIDNGDIIRDIEKCDYTASKRRRNTAADCRVQLTRPRQASGRRLASTCYSRQWPASNLQSLSDVWPSLGGCIKSVRLSVCPAWLRFTRIHRDVETFKFVEIRTTLSRVTKRANMR